MRSNEDENIKRFKSLLDDGSRVAYIRPGWEFESPECKPVDQVSSVGDNAAYQNRENDFAEFDQLVTIQEDQNGEEKEYGNKTYGNVENVGCQGDCRKTLLQEF